MGTDGPTAGLALHVALDLHLLDAVFQLVDLLVDGRVMAVIEGQVVLGLQPTRFAGQLLGEGLQAGPSSWSG